MYKNGSVVDEEVTFYFKAQFASYACMKQISNK